MPRDAARTPLRTPLRSHPRFSAREITAPKSAFPLGSPASREGSLRLFLLRLLGFFFVTVVAFGHDEFGLSVAHFLHRIHGGLQQKTLAVFRSASDVADLADLVGLSGSGRQRDSE